MRKIQTFNVGTFEKNKLIFHTKYLNTKMSISIKVYGFHLIHRYNVFFWLFVYRKNKAGKKKFRLKEQVIRFYKMVNNCNAFRTLTKFVSRGL